jgi:diaminopimelate epimerase
MQAITPHRGYCFFVPSAASRKKAPMHLPFYKYQGTGNDFVIVDNRRNTLHNYSTSLVQKLCNRRFGIGADGFIVIKDHHEYDFEMMYHNADGSQSLCGNGSRCAVHLAKHLGIIDQEAYLLTTDGPHRAYVKEDLIYLQLHDVSEIQNLQDGYLINTGSPHYVRQVDDCEDLDVYKAGKRIRNTPPFQKKGINVNFVSLGRNNEISVRTYERGVEDETFSCGTGVAAAALMAAIKGHKSPVTVRTKGGTLQVSFTKTNNQCFQSIYLIGPAKMVFEGKIDISWIEKDLL